MGKEWSGCNQNQKQELGLFSLEKRHSWGEIFCHFWMDSYKEKHQLLPGVFTEGTRYKCWELQLGKLTLNIREKFFIMGEVKLWEGLGESKLIRARCWATASDTEVGPASIRELDWISPEALSVPNYSPNLWKTRMGHALRWRIE